ncbi:MAG: transporter substrate-binding domain-containing protein [Knoellia sp.]
MPTELNENATELAPTGILRASINLGNPVLAQGTPDAPTGVTIDIAGEVARRLGVDLELLTFDAARKSFEAMANGDADLCFLAIDPARETEVAFTAPYVAIEGVLSCPKTRRSSRPPRWTPRVDASVSRRGRPMTFT